MHFIKIKSLFIVITTAYNLLPLLPPFFLVESVGMGKAIQRTGWGNAKIQAVQLENGQYQIFASGDLTPEMLVLLSGDYDVNEAKETKDVKETEEAV